MLTFRDSFANSAESTICFGLSVVYFVVDLDIRCDGTPQKSELGNCFQFSLNDGYVGRVVLFSGCKLMQDFRLFQTILEFEELYVAPRLPLKFFSMVI